MTVPSSVPSFAARSAPSDFFQGLALIGRATALIFRTPRLLGMSALCAAVTLVAFISLFGALWIYAPDWLGMVWARPEAWFGRLLWGIVFVLLFLVLFVVGASVVVPLVLAPLQDPLSEITEACCGAGQAPPFELGAFFRGLVLGVTHTLARVFFLLLGLAVLFPLNLVPGLGSLAFAGLGTVWTMLWLAGEHLAAPMTRHQYPFAQVRRVLRERWWLCLGFGAGVYVLLWIPFLNNFFLPVAVVGGTLLYRGLLAAGVIPAPPGGK